jgi:hypothetical protein
MTKHPERPRKVTWPAIIPPRSVVRLVRADKRTPMWQHRIGERFRIGYYSEKGGVDCIWLVDAYGDYIEAADRKSIVQYFVLERLSKESDIFGKKKRRLPALAGRARKRS